MRKTFFMTAALVCLVLSGSPAAKAEGTYFGNMRRDFVRGLKNVLSAPLEIPITMQEYHEKSGRPVIRHIAGFFDGTVQVVERFGSGLWDFAVMLIPGDQEGLPIKPETLF